jgi:hypothetical protein
VDQREATDFAARWERDWNAHGLDAIVINYRNHAGNLVCEFLTFADGLVVTGHATYQTDAAAAASGLPSAGA